MKIFESFLSFLKTPKGERAAVFSLFFLAAFLIFWPVLIGGKIFSDEFAVYYHYPIFAFFGERLSEGGGVPLWSNAYLGGFPIYLTQIGFFHPIYWIFFKFFNFLTAYHWLTFFNFFFAALSAWWFGRALGLSPLAAVLTGSTYAFSQLYLYWGALNGFSSFYPALPLFFLAILKVFQGRRSFVFIGAAIMAAALLGSYTEGVWYAAVCGLAFALFLDVANWRKAENILKKFKITARCAAMIAIGGLVASFWIFPVLQFSDLTLRGGGVSLEDASVDDEIKPGDWLRLIYPDFNIPFSGFVPWIKTSTGTGLLYVGIFPLVFAVASFFVKQKDKIHKFFIVLFSFSFLYILKIPLLFWLVHNLPIFNMFRGVWKWHFIANFSLALLAGFGFDRWRPAVLPSRFFHKIIFFGIAVVVSAALGVNAAIRYLKSDILAVLNGYFSRNLYNQTSGKSLDHYYGLIEKVFNEVAASVSLGNYVFFASLAFLVLSLALLTLYLRGRIHLETFKFLGVAIAVLNLIFVWQKEGRFLPAEILNPPESVNFLLERQNAGDIFRSFRFHAGLATYAENGLNEFNSEDTYKLDASLLMPPLHLLYGLDTITASENFMTLRQSRLLAEVGSETAPAHQENRMIHFKIPLEEKINLFASRRNSALLSMMNVKYVLSAFKLPPPWKLVHSSWSGVAEIPVYIFENPNVLPRVYFAEEIKSADDEERAFGLVMENSDFNRETILECARNCLRPGLSAGDDKIEILELKNGSIRFKVFSKNPRWVVYSDSYSPNWTAFVNGQETEIAIANYLYKAVFVPAGISEVVFEYPGALTQGFKSLRWFTENFF